MFDVFSYLLCIDFVVVVDFERLGDEVVVGRVDWEEFVCIVGFELLMLFDEVFFFWY